MRLKLLMLLSGLAWLLPETPVQADLAFFLTPAVQSGAASNEVVFTGTLINTSLTDTLFLNGIQFSFIDLAADYLVADTNVFFANVPGVLLPFETYSDVVFAVAVSPATPPGQYFGFVTLQGGANIFASNNLTSPIFEVSVPLPALGITLSGSHLVLSWPWPSAGFRLWQNADLTTTNWLMITNTPAVTNWQNQVILPLAGTNSFYRLQSP